MKKQLCYLAVALVLAACSRDGGGTGGTRSASPSEVATPGGTVIRHLESDCNTLNWVRFNTVFENYVLRYLYDPLLDYNDKLEIIPVLAESYHVSNDGLTITVVLRDSLFWQDGVPITADDVVFTVEKIRDPAVAAVNKAGLFKRLDRVQAKDAKTVVFTWREPYAPAIHALTQLAPIPKHVYGEGDFNTHPANRAPVGSGAFRFEDWKPAQTITLVRNDQYWAGKPYLDRIIFRIIEDQGAALNALKAGELDEMRVNQAQWAEQTNDEDFLRRFEKYYYYVPQYNYLTWNCRSVWFSDARVRRAMTMLFDRKSLIQNIYSGYAKEVTGPFYVNSPYYDQTIEPWPFDPNQAGHLLDEAGWRDSDGDGIRDKDGVRFEFDFYVQSVRIAVQFAELLQQACREAGIVVNIRQFEGSTFFSKVFRGEYVAAALSWRLDQDPDIFDTFHSSAVPPNGSNHGFYGNPEVDRLLEEGRREFDRDKRIEIYHRIHRLIHEDQPYTFVNTAPEKRPISKRIGNVTISPDGPFNFYPGAIYWYVKDTKQTSQ